MTSAPRSGAYRRSLQDDLLDDMRQEAARATGVPVTAPPPLPKAPSAASAPPTPAVELRITPRSWVPAGWTRRSGGDGLSISLGPLCLSLGRLPG
jgi:hypothetical protein